MNTTTNKKFEYLSETKAIIRAAIEYKGQTVADKDTFRSYANKIKAIASGGSSGGGDVEYVDGVDPYYQKLAETLMLRDASLLGDQTTLSLKGFVKSDGSSLGNLPSYSFAGFKNVDYMVFDSLMLINENALLGCERLKILDITAGPMVDLVGIMANAFSGCTALESVIFRSGGTNLKHASVNNATGANDTFYVYVPSADYDTIIGNLSSSSNIPPERYRKLEDYPEINFWNETYTVNFYDGEELVDSKVVRYGETATTSYKKPGYTLDSWTPNPVNVTENMDCYASWSISFADADWGTIAAISESGEAANSFKVGDTKTFKCNGYTLTAQIAAMGVDTLADGSGKAGITCVINKVYPVNVAHSTSVDNINISPWSNSKLRTYCNDTIYNGLDESLKAVIKKVNKITQKGSGSETTQDYCWALGCHEVGGSSGYESSGPRYSAMFPDATSRKRTNSSGTVVVWNLRGVGAVKMSHYVDVTGKVQTKTGQATARAFLFGFCI
jgi:hypothetical protein